MWSSVPSGVTVQTGYGPGSDRLVVPALAGVGSRCTAPLRAATPLPPWALSSARLETLGLGAAVLDPGGLWRRAAAGGCMGCSLTLSTSFLPHELEGSHRRVASGLLQVPGSHTRLAWRPSDLGDVL